MPSVEDKIYADDKLSEEIVIIGNSSMKDLNSGDDLTKIVSEPGAGIQEVEKELQGVLPENVIVHIDTNDMVRHINRTEELMDKIKKMLIELKEKCVVLSCKALFIGYEWVEDGII